MEDIQIIKQLLSGNHLEPKEIERGYKLIYLLEQELKRRVFKMKVENMTSEKGNKVANQFIIHGSNYVTFQSYESIIATHKDNEIDKPCLSLVADWWDYSNTTRKYFEQFINEYTPFTYDNKAQWLKEIENNDLIEVV